MEAGGRRPSAVPDLPCRRAATRACRPVGGLEEPGDGRGPPDLHDRDDDAECRGRRIAQSDAGHRPRRRVGPLARSATQPSRASSARSSNRATRSHSRSRRRRGSSTTCGTTARNCSWRSTRSRQAPSRYLPQLRGRRRAVRLPHRLRRPAGRRADRRHRRHRRRGQPSTIASGGRPAGSDRPSFTTATSVPLFQPAASAAMRMAVSSSSSATTTTRNSVR